MEEIEKIEKDKYIGYIKYDEDPIDPREDDNLGKMICFHKEYNLGDATDLKVDDFEGWDSLEEYIKNKIGGKVILPLYLYDHSGITISTVSFHDMWDSGQVGFIYATKDAMISCFGHASDIEDKTIKLLNEEIEYYDKYIKGEYYSIDIYKVERCNLGFIHNTFIDGCSGFTEIKEARGELEDMMKELTKC